GAQRELAAAARQVRGVPRRAVLSAAEAIVVAEHRAPLGVAGPAAAGRVADAGRQRAVRVRAREDVVAARADARGLLGERGLDVDRVLLAVQAGNRGRDPDAGGVEPGARTDAIAGVHGRRALHAGRAQIRAPRLVAVTGRRRELLAVRVGASQAREVAPEPAAGTRDEKAHRLRRHHLLRRGDAGRP